MPDPPSLPPGAGAGARVDAAGNKRQLEREDMLFQLEIQERKLALEERKSHMGVEVDERKLAMQEKKL